MADAEFGPSVTSAVRFLSGVYRDIRLLIAALDQEMAARGWVYDPYSGNVSRELGNGTKSKEWVLSWLYRYYLPADDPNHSTWMVGIFIHLDHDEPLTEPMCLACSIEFPVRTRRDTAYKECTSTGPAYAALRGQTGLQPLPASAVKKLARTATTAAAVAIPLCRLRNAEELGREVVSPVTDYFARARGHVELEAAAYAAAGLTFTSSPATAPASGRTPDGCM